MVFENVKHFYKNLIHPVVAFLYKNITFSVKSKQTLLKLVAYDSQAETKLVQQSYTEKENLINVCVWCFKIKCRLLIKRTENQ